MIFQMLALAFSLSIDSFGIGFAYELKGVRIHFWVRVLIGAVSAIVLGLSMIFGSFIQQFIPDELRGIISSLLFTGLGIVFLRNSLLCCADKTYDFDDSNKIEGKEGILLGIALSVDSAVAGIAVATTGVWAIILCIFLGGFQIIMSSMGCLLARKSVDLLGINEKIGGTISGILLIVIGIIWMF